MPSLTVVKFGGVLEPSFRGAEFRFWAKSEIFSRREVDLFILKIQVTKHIICVHYLWNCKENFSTRLMPGPNEIRVEKLTLRKRIQIRIK